MNRKRVFVRVIDRLDRSFKFPGYENQPLHEFLAQHRIPTSAVIAFRDGKPVSEWSVILDGNHEIELKMVRAYHLPDIIDTTGALADIREAPIYTKSALMFTEDGGGIRKTSHMGSGELTQYLHDTFKQSLLHPSPMIKEGDHLIVGFSGGRDSLAMMLMFSRLREEIPEIKITAVTVNDCIAELDLNYTKSLCGRFSVDHLVIEPDDIQRGFKLKKKFPDCLQALYNKYGRQHSLYALHHVMRRMVESVASELKTDKIVLGLHLEDITASILRSLTTGYIVGYPWHRSFGKFSYLYPLWNITKKEITLYLLDTAQEYSEQGSAATFDRGTVDRDIYYASADSIQDIWPGFSQHLYLGYEALLNQLKEGPRFECCCNCGSEYALSTYYETYYDESNFCAVCNDFKTVGVLWEK